MLGRTGKKPCFPWAWTVAKFCGRAVEGAGSAFNIKFFNYYFFNTINDIPSFLHYSNAAFRASSETFVSDYFLLGIAALFAGMVDAVVGGGGLVQLPALFSTLPTMAPATLLGTSKLAGVWGTAVAALTYARRVKIPWNTAAPGAIAAFAFSFLGAFTVTRVPPDFLRQLLPFW